jgi:hypothetical protein
MPQASDKLREQWVDDRNALDYLAARGIRERRGGLLVIPNGFELNDMDVSAIRYMIDEWDYDWEQEM